MCYYGYPGEGARFCQAHKLDGMVRLRQPHNFYRQPRNLYQQTGSFPTCHVCR